MLEVLSSSEISEICNIGVKTLMEVSKCPAWGASSLTSYQNSDLGPRWELYIPHTRVIGTQMAMVSRYSPRPYLHLVNNTEWYLRLYKWRINEWMNEIASFTVGAENPETSLVYRTRPRTTLCLKKVPTFKLSVTLSNLIGFSKFLHCWKAYEICYKTHMTPPTSP